MKADAKTWTLTIERKLSPADLRAASRLFDEAGMRPRAPRALGSAIARSTTIVARDANRSIIGIGRLIGDGVYYATLWDVAVARAWRKQGVGRAIIEALLDVAREQKVEMTGLFTAPHNFRFYRHYGFTRSRDIRAMIRVKRGRT